jgi:integrase
VAGKKRSNGEGTVGKQRRDGRFQGQVSVLTATGHRKRVSYYGKTKQEVVAKMNAAKMDSQKGIPIPEHSWRVGEWLDYWLEHEIGAHKRPLTYVDYEVVVRKYLKPGLGNRVLHDLSALKLQQYIDGLGVAGEKPGQIRRIRKVLSGALTYAMQQDLVVRNVAHLVQLPTYTPKEAEPWTLEEAKRFLEVAKSEREYTVYVLFLTYGLRLGEATGLRWSDIDFDNNILHIRQQLRRLKGGVIHQGPPKTQSSKRSSPLLAAVAASLRQYRATQAQARSAWEAEGNTWENLEGDEAAIFTTKTGRPIHHTEIRRVFYRLCDQNGIRHIKLHDLRHTATTLLENLGIPPKDVQAILGHGDLRTTRIYEHSDIEAKRRALEVLEGQFFESAAVIDRGDCRQKLPSNRKIPSPSTTFPSGMWGLLGGSVYTLGGSMFGTVEHRLQSVIATLEACTRSWLVGCIAVSVALKFEQALNGEPATGSPFHIADPASTENVLGRTCLTANGVGRSGQLAHDVQPL